MKRILSVLVLASSVVLSAQQPTPLDRAKQLQVEIQQLVDALTPQAVVTVGPSLTVQAAANAATPGMIICVPDGVFVGETITLPFVAGASPTNPMTLRSCTPTPNGLASSSPVTLQPRPTDTFTLHFAKGAAYWNIIGLRFTSANASATILAVGDGTETSVADQPHDIVFDRVVADGGWSAKVGVAMNGGRTALINSTVTGVMKVGQDTQAVGGSKGPGPFLIENNFLNGGTETILFGGSDPLIPGLIPTNIVIRGNTITRPVDPMKATKLTVKNTLELKNAQHVLIEGNIIEQSWVDGQTGFCLAFTVRDQDGGAPWSTISDVEVRYNVVRHCDQGVTILGLDDIINPKTGLLNVSVRMANIRIHDNLFYDLAAAGYGIPSVVGGGAKFAMFANNGPTDTWLTHNTFVGPVTVGLACSSGPTKTLATGLIVRDSIFPEGGYGIKADAVVEGVPSWTACTDTASVFDFNQVVKGTSGRKIIYPGTHNTIGAVTFDAGFVATPTMLGSDGKPVGADLAAIRALIPALDLTK
jgi:hypothetical protein